MYQKSLDYLFPRVGNFLKDLLLIL